MELVELHISGEAILKLDVRGRLVSSTLISGIRVRKLLSSGVKGYLTFLINTPGDKVKLENVEEIAFLGHIISKEGITVDPTKVKAVSKWK